MTPSGSLVAILPCNDLDASERFYNRLGFTRPDSEKPAAGEPDTYRTLSNGHGGHLHLTDVVEGWLVPGRNPFGLYLYVEDVDALAREFQQIAQDMPWGMYEFAVSDPDETLVRVGRPTRLRTGSA
ncbi:putative Glyoxalase family protein [Bradyrhizobium sp. ORS 285]|uniref:VOC family protein n=1 Tax=Bradyrhizobium sp. ORS 285 TaxID=115808 RepID=UPI0002405C48|nr:VOC family protein [Bradyrhizobium sp. ORS 285]CCD87143.1 putative Glyoxalase family protein [Bradyrhizobium sp. ORS 285]SMX60171.1 putative Glyoxalase family protein [Bradyrhizobium sp. ORS 285]